MVTLVLVLTLASCSQSPQATTIDCRLVVGSDANSDTGSIPFGPGELELATAEVQASIVVTFGERGGSIDIAIDATGVTEESAAIMRASGGVDPDPQPGAVLVGVQGGDPDTGPFGVDCWSQAPTS